MIRISAPESAKRGEVIELKAMIQHPMESGYRRDEQGKIIPREIITEFKCTYDGAAVFEATFFPGVAANPFVSFFARASRTGTLEFTWADQNGKTWSESRTLTVT